MIAYLKGTVLLREPDRLIVNTGNLGYLVRVDQRTGLHTGGLGSEVELYTYQQVTEKDVTLFGFDSLLKLELFQVLISANKVGPKTALNFLSALPCEEILRAILSKDPKSFGKISGAGPKLLSQVILDCHAKALRLSEKFGVAIEELSGSEQSEEGGFLEPAMSDEGTVSEALKQLGFTRTEIKKSLSHVSKAKGYQSLNQEQVIGECLKYFYKANEK